MILDREESSKELKVESGKLGFHDPISTFRCCYLVVLLVVLFDERYI
jgi:hypothetical protein